MILFAAAFALQTAVPRPGELRTFQDWTVGCDNVRACHAVSLVDPEAGGPAWPTLSLRRSAGGTAEPVLSLDSREDLCGSALVADGQRLPVRLIEAAQCSVVHPDDVPALLAALRSARELDLIGPEGVALGAVSLAGASAAMLYIDEAQGRLDTATALVHRGDRPASAVPPAPPLPLIRMTPAPEDSALEIDDAGIAALRREVGCTLGEVGGPVEHSAVPLETGKTLVLLACGTGAYNLTLIPFVARTHDGRIEIEPAPFDRQAGMEEGGRVALVNAEWDYERRLLTEFSRGRGLGDCGTRAAYAWDGERFRLAREESMGECRGVYDFITTWRARAVRP